MKSRAGLGLEGEGWGGGSDMKARGVDEDPARGAVKQERDRAEDKFTVSSHDKKSETTRYCGSDYFRGVVFSVAKRAKPHRAVQSP